MGLTQKISGWFKWLPRPKNYLFLGRSKKANQISELANQKLQAQPRPLKKKPSIPLTPISPRVVKPSFFTFQDEVYDHLDRLKVTETGVNIFRDQGLTENNKDFFFLKPNQADGLLLERTDRGFIICQAKHISTRNLFVRSSQPFDQALFVTAVRKGNLTLSREGFKDIYIKSTRYSKSQLSINDYVKKLMSEILQSGTKVDWMQAAKLDPQDSPEKTFSSNDNT